MEDGEGQGDVENDANQPGANSHVEAGDTLILVDRGETVGKAIVLASIDTLHLGLDDIDGVVGHSGAETSESTGQKVDDDLDGDVVTEHLLSVLEHDESHALV